METSVIARDNICCWYWCVAYICQSNKDWIHGFVSPSSFAL